jgi:hypothetical protein
LVKLVTEDPPDGATRWTMEALSKEMAAHGVPISASQCWRICQALDLKPWQVRSWMTSHDPDFSEKAGDVCGLYLNPPEGAVVWSVDEKSARIPLTFAACKRTSLGESRHHRSSEPGRIQVAPAARHRGGARQPLTKRARSG